MPQVDFNIGDSVLHMSNSTYFVVDKRVKSKKTGEVTLKDAAGNPYLASDCCTPQQAGCIRFASGLVVCTNLPTSQPVLEASQPIPESEITPEAREIPLDEREDINGEYLALDTVLAIVEGMIECGDFTDLELLEALTQEQKRQVWGALSVEQRDVLKAARQVAAQCSDI